MPHSREQQASADEPRHDHALDEPEAAQAEQPKHDERKQIGPLDV